MRRRLGMPAFLKRVVDLIVFCRDPGVREQIASLRKQALARRSPREESPVGEVRFTALSAHS